MDIQNFRSALEKMNRETKSYLQVAANLDRTTDQIIGEIIDSRNLEYTRSFVECMLRYREEKLKAENISMSIGETVAWKELIDQLKREEP